MSNTILPPKIEIEDVQTEILNTLNRIEKHQTRIQYYTQRTEQHTSRIKWGIICIMFLAFVIPAIMTTVLSAP